MALRISSVTVSDVVMAAGIDNFWPVAKRKWASTLRADG